jgi:hypothetical protein
MAHSDAREGKWREYWRMEWVAGTLHTTWEQGVSSITTADAHTSAASSRLNWRPCRSKWTRPIRRKTKSGFCACAITFQKQSTCALPRGKGAWIWPSQPLSPSVEITTEWSCTSTPPWAVWHVIKNNLAYNIFEQFQWHDNTSIILHNILYRRN